MTQHGFSHTTCQNMCSVRVSWNCLRCFFSLFCTMVNYESWVVPAGVGSALADILEAEFRPIIDFVLERGGVM